MSYGVPPGIEAAPPVHAIVSIPYIIAPVAIGTQAVLDFGQPAFSIGVRNNSPFTVYIREGQGMAVSAGGVSDPSAVGVDPFSAATIPLNGDKRVTVRIDVPTTTAGSVQTPAISVFISSQPAQYDARPIQGAAITTVGKGVSQAASPNTLWTPAAGKKIRIWGVLVSVSVQADASLYEYDPTGATQVQQILAIPSLPPSTVGVSPWITFLPSGFLLKTKDDLLRLVSSAGSIGGTAIGTEE